MRSAMFLKGGHELFATIGLSYGFLVIEDMFARLFLCDMKSGKEVLKKTVECGVLTGDQAGVLEAAMIEAGLVEDYVAFFQKIKDLVLPADNNPTHLFNLCAGCNKSPLLHGDIIIAKDGIQVKYMQSVLEGLQFCDEQVENGKMSAPDAVAILKAASAANLPTDDEDIKKKYDALPEETRRQCEQGRMRVVSIVIPGLGRGTFLDI